MHLSLIRTVVVSSLFLGGLAVHSADGAGLKVLFLGDSLNESGHDPIQRYEVLAPAFAAQGLTLSYTNSPAAFNAETLAQYDALLLYNNLPTLAEAEEKALLKYVNDGRGLVVAHCASFAFRNSDAYINLVGGQFKSHGNEVFAPVIVDAQHPATHGVKEFAVREESYVHTRLTNDRRVLMLRDHKDGNEPWTWTREQGKGRVFYTASGHYLDTWKQADFQKLLAQGVRWAAGKVNEEKPVGVTVPAEVPRYTQGYRSETVATMTGPLSPADSLKHMHVPAGFRVELFAAEPDVIKPMAMAFDARGRLWVAESVDYPNNIVPEPHKNGNDRIKICEDTDGDGKADKFTVFADKLNIPTGLVFARGGVIVAVAPHLLFLQDTDGDGVADRREIILTGFERFDTHATLSNLHYGHDNWIYGSVGYSGGKVKVGNTVHQFRQGFFRFRADGSAFEVLGTSSNNTWGFGQDEEGNRFGSTANNEHIVHLAMPNRFFESVRGWHGKGIVGIEDHKMMHPVTEDVRQVDVFGGFTAASGSEIYTARRFPERYWNRYAIVCEPTGHLIHLDKLVRQGSRFVARDGFNLMASSDPWTSPVAAQVGPDGAVWFLDWYNYIIQHNPTPHGFENGRGNAYITPVRDQLHGRIYRIVPENTAEPAPRNLEQANAGQLVAGLRDDNLLWRLHAQRLLVERQSGEAIAALVEQVKSDAPFAASHALQTLSGMNYFANGENAEALALLETSLKSSHAVVRRAALSVLPDSEKSVALVVNSGVLKDADLLARRDALLALAELPSTESAGQALAALLQQPENLQDEWVNLALVSAAARNDLAFLKATLVMPITPEQLESSTQVLRIVAEHYGRGGPMNSVAEVVKAGARAPASLAEALIVGVASGWPANSAPAMSPEFEQSLGELRRKLTLVGQLQVAALANRWGVGEKFQADINEIKQSMLDRIGSADMSEADQIRTARELMSLASDSQTLNGLLGKITPKTSPELARAILEAAAQSYLPETGTAFVSRWSSFTPSLRRSALSQLLNRPEWTQVLLTAIEDRRVPFGDLSVEHIQRLRRHPDAECAKRANKLLDAGGLASNADRQEIVTKLIPLAQRHGDVAQGREVFQQNCAVCHLLNGQGAKIGPDLTGFAGGNREEVLLHILDPNRSVEANYRQYTLTTTDGQSLTGLLAAENKTALELVDGAGQKHVLLRDKIQELTSSTMSLMPEGFENLPENDLVSLLDFLTQRGRVFALPLQKAANTITTQGMFIQPDGPERMIFDSWGAKSFEGITFRLVDPEGGTVPNAIVLHGPMTELTQTRPQAVSLSCNSPVERIHLLSGVSGWGYPAQPTGSISLIVRLHYKGGAKEDHSLTNGIHFSDYIRRVDVPGSKYAFDLGGKQLRYLAIEPQQREVIETIEFVKGPDRSAPVIMAVTVEAPETTTATEPKKSASTK